jgi:hypothetical protein
MSASRYDQCDETCTIDCGHCKGAGFALIMVGRDGATVRHPENLSWDAAVELGALATTETSYWFPTVVPLRDLVPALFVSFSVAADGTIYGGATTLPFDQALEHGVKFASVIPDSWVEMIAPAEEFDAAFGIVR